MNLLTSLFFGTFILSFVYFGGFFLFPRIAIPHMGFKKSQLPQTIPQQIMSAIEDLKKRSRNKYDYLKKTYHFLTTKYHGQRNTVLWKPHLWFTTDLATIWQKRGFLPCHVLSYLTRVFLVKSNYFSDHDIEVRHTFFNFNIHQYLKVTLNKKKAYYIDPWGRHIGIKFGQYCHLFK